MRNQRGITLIALVITIIVLLILAGVSIAMLTGDNGILTKASDSDVETKRAEAADKINMVLNAEYTDILSQLGTYTLPTEDTVKTENGLDGDSEYSVDFGTSATTEGAVITVTWTPSNSKYGNAISGSINYDPDATGSIKYTIEKATK